MITYGMLSREKIEIYRDYLTQEAYSRRQDGNVFFYGASTETEIVGVVAFEAETEGELLSIAVSPEWQRQGIGSELVDRIADLLFEHNGRTLQAFLSGTDEERQGLAHFLWRCGFHLEDEAPVGSFTLGEALKSDVMKKASELKKAPGIKKLCEVEPITIKTFGKSLAAQGLYYGWETGNFDPEYSSIYLEEGTVTGCVLVGEEDGELELKYVYVDKSNRDSVALLRLLAHSMNGLIKKYPEETRVSTVAVNPASEKILTKVLGESIITEQVCRYLLPLSLEETSI